MPLGEHERITLHHLGIGIALDDIGERGILDFVQRVLIKILVLIEETVAIA